MLPHHNTINVVGLRRYWRAVESRYKSCRRGGGYIYRNCWLASAATRRVGKGDSCPRPILEGERNGWVGRLASTSGRNRDAKPLVGPTN